MNNVALTYDDIQLIPSYSDIKHRRDISLKSLVSKRYGVLLPFIASPMDTVCEEEMAFKLFQMGAVGVIHRFMPIELQVQKVKWLVDKIYDESTKLYEDWGIMLDDWHSEIKAIPIMAAIGIKEEDKNRAINLVEAGANILVIDVAHGHHQNVANMVKWCKLNLKDTVDIIAGNVATKEATIFLQNAGVDGIRAGVGSGCFTPDMEVKTSDGLKKIKDIQIGDEVYTHTGELKPVINKFEYNDYDKIYDVDGIEVTYNHKFYVVHESKADLVDSDNIHEYAEWIAADKLSDEYFLIELD